MFQMSHVFPQSIPWSTYIQVVTKIATQHKAVYRDFLKSGVYFKLAVFLLINKIYIMETIPEAIKKTVLTKLYKNRGSVAELKNHRFIHGKSWVGKLSEKCFVAIMFETIIENTPECQIGGVPGSSTVDHIMTTVAATRVNERQNMPTIASLIDLRACFDRIRLNDVIFDVIGTGADIKAVKMIKELSKETIISIAGDPKNNRTAVVEDALAQGSKFAAPGAGLTIGLITEEAIPIENCLKVGTTTIPPRDYVDDALILNKGVDETRINGERFSRAVQTVSLQCNPVKSAVVVIGGKNNATKLARENLRDDPMKLHNSPVDVKTNEPYLGFMLHEDGVKASINMTSKLRGDKAWGKAAMIKAVINHPGMLQFGWLRGGVTLLKAIIPPVLTYSCEVWAGCPKYIMDNLEATYKKIIYTVLDIPEKTKFAAVLLELGMSRIRHAVNKRQIIYMNKVIWLMEGKSITKSCVMEEHRVNGDRSMLANVDRLCDMYSIPRVSEFPVDKSQVKSTIKMAAMTELWRECFESSIIPSRPYIRITNFSHFSWPRSKSRAILLWRTGGLKFKTQWKLYNVKRGIGIGCLMPVCPGLDNLDHVKNCPFYETKWDNRWKDDEELAIYLVKINRERTRRFKMPIL